jgi:site-specific DNA-methyltransferase (cytosine-N4-specific)
VEPFVADSDFTLFVGHVIDVLRELPDASVQCVVTSPPFWGLRNYETVSQFWGDGWYGSLGEEPTPEQYVSHLVEVFAEVRRVLREDGTLWLNLGDSYARPAAKGKRGASAKQDSNKGTPQVMSTLAPGLKQKDLVGIPWMTAFALRADGWYLRAEIIAAKRNPMPDSVTDRPTKSHEQLFLLTKSARYYYDQQAVMEPSDSEDERNMRSVWTLTNEPYAEGHFATFPTKLVEPCVKAGTSWRGCCLECGAPWDRSEHASGWSPGCGCNAGLDLEGLDRWRRFKYEAWPTSACVVLDPFIGSGTTAWVTRNLERRKTIGIELNPEYAQLAANRMAQQSLLQMEEAV